MDPTTEAEQRHELLRRRSLSLRDAASTEVWLTFERAAGALDAYLAGLALEDLGPLSGSPLSPNVLRAVRTSGGRAAVLKLVGEPRTGEAATLAAWTAGGVNSVPLLEHGIGAWTDGVTHLLVGWVPGEPMPHSEMAAATGPVVAVLAGAHLAKPAGVEDLADSLRPRLRTAEQVWSSAGLTPPVRVDELLSDVPGSVLLHGDPVGMNLLVDRGSIRLLDPAGVAGPAEFDAGRWVARSLAVAGPGALAGLTETALRADPSLRPDVLDLCVAVELLIEVRHRITSRDMFLSLGAAASSFDADTATLASASRSLAGR